MNPSSKTLHLAAQAAPTLFQSQHHSFFCLRQQELGASEPPMQSHPCVVFPCRLSSRMCFN